MLVCGVPQGPILGSLLSFLRTYAENRGRGYGKRFNSWLMVGSQKVPKSEKQTETQEPQNDTDQRHIILLLLLY